MFGSLRNWCLAATVALATLAPGSAAAQDGSGFYLGIHAGYLSGDFNVDKAEVVSQLAIPLTRFDDNGDGVIAGLLAGYDHRWDAFLAGIEVDLALTSFESGPVSTALGTAKADVDWMVAVRGRLGYQFFPSTLAYLTAGIAFAEAEAEAVVGGATFRDDPSLIGFQIGAGLQHALDRNWSLRLEYLYTNFGNEDFTGGSAGVATAGFDLETHAVRGAIVFHLPPM